MQEFLTFFDLTPLDAQMILVSVPLFVLFLRACDSALIKPFLDRINERDQLTTGAGSSAEATIQEAAALEQEYARKVADARSAAVKARLGKVGAAKDEAARIVQHAESEVAQRVTTERQKVRQQIESQRSQLLADVDSLAQGIVQKLSQPRSLSVLALLVAVASLLVSPAGAMASSSGHEAGGHHGYEYLFWYWVNFLIYIVAMYFILRNMVASGWGARRERIRFALEAGKRALEEAAVRHSAAKAKLAQADKEISEMVSSIEIEGQKEAQKLVSDAREKAVEIQTQATESLGLEAKAQKAHMQREVAEIVLARATEMLKSSVTKESDRALRQGAVAGVKSLIQ